MAVVMGTQLDGVEEIFGIKRIRSIDIHIAYDDVVSAKVEFLLDEVQAKAVLQLCRDGKWRSPPIAEKSEVETTCMESTWRTYLPVKAQPDLASNG